MGTKKSISKRTPIKTRKCRLNCGYLFKVFQGCKQTRNWARRYRHQHIKNSNLMKLIFLSNSTIAQFDLLLTFQKLNTLSMNRYFQGSNDNCDSSSMDDRGALVDRWWWVFAVVMISQSRQTSEKRQAMGDWSKARYEHRKPV